MTKSSRLGTVFHETFPLSRQSISKITRAVYENSEIQDISQSLREQYFQEKTGLGTRYIKSMPRYAIGCGIISQNYAISLFGRYTLMHDEGLDQISTQWLMHYYFCAPQGPGPFFWNRVVSKFFYPGNVFTNEELIEFIGNLIWETENKVLSKRAVQSTVTILLGTYTKPEGLGKLRILEMTDSGRYRVQVPVNPPVWAAGYALLDFWMANFDGRISVGIDTLKESGFVKLFLMADSDLNEVLQSLQEIRYLDVHRTAPPFQVVLLRQDQEPILEKLYGSN